MQAKKLFNKTTTNKSGHLLRGSWLGLEFWLTELR